MNESHLCIHEKDFGAISSQLHTVCTDVKDIKDGLFGNGGDGLKGRTIRVEEKMEALESKIASIPSAKALAFYASCGGGFIVFIGFMVKAVFG